MQREDVDALISYMRGEKEDEGADLVAALLDRAEKAEAMLAAKSKVNHELIRGQAEILAANHRLKAELAKLRADGGAEAAFDERKLHDLWTMGNCRMSFDSFKGRLRDALARPSAPETLAWAVVGRDGRAHMDSFTRNKDELDAWYCEPGERVVRVAIRVVED